MAARTWQWRLPLDYCSAAVVVAVELEVVGELQVGDERHQTLRIRQRRDPSTVGPSIDGPFRGSRLISVSAV